MYKKSGKYIQSKKDLLGEKMYLTILLIIARRCKLRRKGIIFLSYM